MNTVLHIPVLSRTRRQSIPLSGGRVNHTIIVKQEKPVAVILDIIVFPINAALSSVIAAMGAGGGQEAEVAADR